MDLSALRQALVSMPASPSRPVAAIPAAVAKSATPLRVEVQALRAVAVGLVIGYHLWPKAIPGGFIGVDVFFVISGFLITSLLVRELERTDRISLTNFWARRARRILPAALVVIGVTAAATFLFVPVNLWSQYLGDLRASTLYVQNWHLAHAAVDYFAAEQSPSPVQHYWSLAVEEQFYVVWPVLLLVATLLTRGRSAVTRRRALAGFIGVATLASVVYGIRHTAANPADAYFATTTRAWELGAGALLALAPAPRLIAPARAALSIAGLAAIAVAAGAFTTATQFPGAAALLPVLGAVAVIRAGAPGGRLTPTPLYGWAPVQFLGGVSYSAYLWHWPLLILAPYVLHRDLTTSDRISVLMLTILIAWLSRTVLEDPIRTSRAIARRGARPTFAVAAAATVAVMAVTAVGTDHVQAQIQKDEAATKRTLASHPKCFGAVARDPRRTCRNPKLRTTVVPTPVQAPKMDNSPCEVVESVGRIRSCAFGATPEAARSTFALIGDSHASHWRSALTVLAKHETWRGLSVTHTSCPYSAAVPVIDEPGRTECQEWKQQTQQWLVRHPEVTTVFLGQHAGGDIVHKPNIDTFTAQMNGYTKIWKAFPPTVKHVFVLRDTPMMHSGTLDCVQRALTAHKNAGTACAVPVRDAFKNRDPAAAAVQRRHPPRVKTLDINRLLCSPRVCFPVIGGALVYKDIHHLTSVFSASLGPYLEQQVDRYLRTGK
jgi:peptidoglycan/LPS O-acetylase OafA/YrhL